MLTVVTGATGHLGNNLVRALLERGQQVRALVLPKDDPRPLAGLAVEQVEGCDAPDGQIIEEVQCGYVMGNKVLRVAKVKVAKTKENKEVRK